MANATQAFTAGRVQMLALVGVGAATAGFVQASGIIPVATPNVRDLIMAAVGAVVASMGGPMMRNFGVGFAAAPVGSLITRNVFAFVAPGP